VADELPELLVPDAQAWRAWLESNHAAEPGVRLVLHKKGGTVTELTYEAALQEALCFGWIDGQVNRRDDGSFWQRFTPRRTKSPWSASNVARVAELIADGRMRPAGQAAIDSAKADGRWDKAYAGPATAQLPSDLIAAIAANPKAQATFDRLTSQNRYALYYRVNEAKRADTRARRIAQFVDMLARGETVHPQSKQAKLA
jgi:uncharacterized protein YdeI (YjbR/CyaY-like superfamily)